jgi:nuclear GTP-binding protein
MYDDRPIRNKQGKITKAGAFMSSKPECGDVARVQPNRRWFGNTRTIAQKDLEQFREEMTQRMTDSYNVVLHQKQLPMALVSTSTKPGKMNLLSIEKFEDTFGRRATRKKPKLAASSLEALLQKAEVDGEGYKEEKDSDVMRDTANDVKEEKRRDIFEKGQSKRIWGELYKVIDSSDVLIQVLDARDPLGTRSKQVEAYIKKNCPHKHIILVLNKCDLVPTWLTSKWVRLLSEEYPTLAFHASVTNSFGKGALIQLLRQYGVLHKEKQQISVGFVGYPNVGKSSVINTLKKKKVCKVAPIPGETKVWQYITLFKRIYLIDCPGVVPAAKSERDTDTEILLKGVVRVENLDDPVPHVEEVLNRVESKYISQIYGVEKWSDYLDFLGQVAKNRGRLLKGGEPDLFNTAKGVLHDWQRGRLPWFVPPPESQEESEVNTVEESANDHQFFMETFVTNKKQNEDEDEELLEEDLVEEDLGSDDDEEFIEFEDSDVNLSEDE